MIILSIDTCCNCCEVSILRDGFLLAKEQHSEYNRQTEFLIYVMERALLAADIQYEDLNLVAVTIGPASFTGLRVGLTAAYAIASSLSIPCVGVETLELLAHQIFSPEKPRQGILPDERFYITFSAGRSRYYCQLFNAKINKMGTIFLCTAEEINNLEHNAYGDHQNKYHLDTTLSGILAMKIYSQNSYQGLPSAIYEKTFL